MRILRLDLLAFGPFTGRSLDFGNGSPGLQIVYGPNEAGKTSSLRALRNLLYGIPERSPDDFVHSYKNLRIGGVLEAADGTRLEFIRRKGRSKTLRGPDDGEVFDESRLQQLLGGVDEAMFCRRFGIDCEELRRGGESVVCGGGDLGEILFAAGAGLADLRKIQQRLDAEAETIFKARGSNQRIAQALLQLKQSREAIRNAQLPTSAWVEHDEALRQAERGQREIDEELDRKRRERSRLDRIRRSLPLISRLKPLREALAAVADAPLLPETFPGDRREAETNLGNAKKDQRLAEREIERLERDLRGIEVPVELMEHRTAIAQLHTDLGSIRKAARDRPGLVGRRDGAQQQARELLQELGRTLEPAEAESLRLSKVQRKRIQDLGGEFKALVERQQSSEQAVRKLALDIERVEKALKQLPPERDTAELERIIRRVQKQGDLDAQHGTAAAELQRLREQANVELKKLRLFAGTLEELERLPVPPAETIDRFEHELSDADRDISGLREQFAELTAANQELQNSLEALRLEREVPSEADLQQARRRRDAGWQLVQQVWRDRSSSDDPAVAAFIDEFSPGGDLVAAFRESIEAADAVADRLRREADRVARNARLTADLQQAQRKLAEAAERLERVECHRQDVWNEWRKQWEPASVEPLSPREMRAWRNTQQSLVGLAADVRNRQVQLQRLSSLIESSRAELTNCLHELDQSHESLKGSDPFAGHRSAQVLYRSPAKGSDPVRNVPEDEPLSTMLDRCEQIAEQIRSANQQRDQLLSEQEKLIQQQSETERQADEASRQVSEWRMEWAMAVAELGLDGDSKPSQANALIEAVDDLLKLLKESRELDERIGGIDADAEKFEQLVRQLIEQVAADLLDTLSNSVEQALADLIDRLSRAERDQTKLDGLQEQLQIERGRKEDAESRLTQWQQALGRLCEQAGCSTPAELTQAEERSRTRRETEAELKRLEQQLYELAAGTALDEWITTADEFDSDQVQASLTSLADQIAGLEHEKNGVSEAVGQHRNELSRMDGSGKAAEAQIQAEHLLASIRGDAEEYIRRRLASVVLSRAIERFRETNQGPVLDCAAELFADLTLGSFAGLRADYDSSGNAVLVGIRAGGQSVPVTGMSDGTCDQLYLALRLALLESSLQHGEPLPLIVDDVLVMFDDDRARAALRALARLSKKTQVVFFTHHEHLLEVAREALDSSLLCIQRLDASAGFAQKRGQSPSSCALVDL
ncbi:MAG: AAA family ATPase [Planctomycetes bacterium]|nr:AAA family ATPase [Planctomycetota bacterium]